MLLGVSQVHAEAEFVFDALVNRQPVQLFHDRRDVVPGFGVADETGAALSCSGLSVYFILFYLNVTIAHVYRIQ